MIIFVKCLVTDTLIELSTYPSETTISIKKKLLSTLNYRIDQQRLIFQTVVLDDFVALQDQSVDEFSTLYLDIYHTKPPSEPNRSYLLYLRSFRAILPGSSSKFSLESVPTSSHLEIQFCSSAAGYNLNLSSLVDASVGPVNSLDIVETCGQSGAKLR